MQLTRRDALAALAAGGVGAAVFGAERGGVGSDSATPAAGTATPGDSPEPADAAGLGPHERDTLLAVADVVYPSDLTGVEEFVTTYLDGRASRPGYVPGVSAAVERLDRMGEEWHGGPFVELEPDTRERLLRETGADTAEPDPDGSPAGRIRYYLVNELLYALYSSPAGGELVGLENPQGYPGGTDSYQRGPRA